MARGLVRERVQAGENSMNEQQHTAVTPSAAPSRRKLLRGALAVPAVLTVYSGGALATASFERCLANAQLHKRTETTSQTMDAWLRVRLYRSGPSGDRKFWVHGNDLNSPLISKGINHTAAVPKLGEYQQFDPRNSHNNLIPDTVTTTPPSDIKYVNRFAAVRLDSKGLVVGVGAGTEGSAIGQSCWSSFIMGAG
jgi:hypothetical protein